MNSIEIYKIYFCFSEYTVYIGHYISDRILTTLKKDDIIIVKRLNILKGVTDVR